MKSIYVFLIYILFLLTGLVALAQPNFDLYEIKAWQMEQDSAFRDTASTPLKSEDLIAFQGLKYFPINEKYTVLARFEPTKGEPFEMPTSTDRTPVYQQYGLLHFDLMNASFSLPVYQNVAFKNKAGFEDYLFLPFTDLTNAIETYGGGRYVDMKIVDSEFWTIDFNKSYNPYCAYNDRYSCPIPPIENHLNIRVEAGTLKFHEDH